MLRSFLAAATAALLLAPAARADTQIVSDPFSSYALGAWAEGSAHGPWTSRFNGFGVNQVIQPTNPASRQLELKPKASTSPGETHASLVTSQQSFAGVDVSAKVTTAQQLRTGSASNPWEVGWLLWRYTDSTHFYYFALKANGWELGKADPAYPGAQRFLATGSTPTAAIASTHTIRVRNTGNEIGVYVDGTQVAYFQDTERPYATGQVGLYTEDATARFDDLAIWSAP